jgi:hypothetical protein
MPGTFEIDYSIPYETEAAPRHEIGQRAEAPDGSIFRYSEMGSTTGVANKLYQGAAAVGNWQKSEHTVDLVVGDTEISFFDGGSSGSADFAVDEAAGGHIVVESAADLGHVYRIKSNLVTDTNQTIMQLMPGVSVIYEVLDASGNHLTFTKNQWKEVILSIQGINTAANAGVPRVIILKDAFGWLQTRGVSSCIVDSAAEAVLVGNGIRAGNLEAGAVSLWDETSAADEIDYTPMGYCMFTADTSNFAQIYLQVE